MRILSRLIFTIILIDTISDRSAESFIDVDLINAYFQEKNIHRSYVIVCLEKYERMLLLKTLVIYHQMISVLNIQDVLSTEFLKVQHNHVGVILDGDCNARITSDFLKQENHSYLIEDVYNPAYGKGGELKRRIIGYYSLEGGYPSRQMERMYWLRKNMTGVTLKSRIVLPVPFRGTLMDYLNSEIHREVNTFNRFHYSLMSPCVNYYNFTPDVSLTESWGYLTENGTFDGLVGALSEQSADYGSSPLFVRTDRAKVMEYGRRTWTLRAAFIFRIPESKKSVDVFIKPLSLSIWLSTMFSSILVVLLLRFAQLHERRIMNRFTDTTWSYFVLCTVGALCQQGMTVTPSSYSGRIILMSLLILSIMIYQFYSASLVSHLLMKPETQMKSIENILNSHMKVGCEDTLYNRDYFLYTTDEASIKLYHKKILGQRNHSNFLEPRKGLVFVKDGGYAFHVELATAYPIIQNTFPDKSICELREVQMYRTQPMHANYQKHSPFRDMFDTCLQHLAEFGILYREISFWHPKKPECIIPKTATFNIGLDYFYPAFLFLGIGMTISLVILTFEIAMSFKSRRFGKEVIPILPYTK